MVALYVSSHLLNIVLWLPSRGQTRQNQQLMLPVQKQFDVQIPDGQQYLNESISIPAGTWLRITHVSGWLSVPSAQTALMSIGTAAWQIDVPGGTTTGVHFLPPFRQTDGRVVFGQSTNIPTMGAWVALSISRSAATGTVIGQITLVGELTQAPAAPTP